LHPYSWSLISAAAPPGPLRDRLKKDYLVKGDPPSPVDPPPGCRFAQRCPFVVERCRDELPILQVRPRSTSSPAIGPARSPLRILHPCEPSLWGVRIAPIAVTHMFVDACSMTRPLRCPHPDRANRPIWY
jgi:oligopeptide/dipeptide ABC transporter ATP-binding protein